jgi:hypothetical protein
LPFPVSSANRPVARKQAKTGSRQSRKKLYLGPSLVQVLEAESRMKISKRRFVTRHDV